MKPLVLLVLLALGPAAAQVARHTVSVTVPGARLFEVDPDDVELILTTPTPDGFEPVTSTSTYSLSISNKALRGSEATYRITVHSAEAYPDGVDLSVEVGTASSGRNGGTSTGAQAVPVGVEDAVAVVTGLRKVNGRGRPITYTASAGLTAVPGRHTRTVVYTLSQE